MGLVEDVIIWQKLTGGLVVIENPRTSDIWQKSSLRRWVNDDTMAMAQVDLCMYGMESSTGQPMRKGLSLLTNSKAFADDISLRCHGGHEHQVVQGKETALSAVYPDAFARAVAKSYNTWKRSIEGNIVMAPPVSSFSKKTFHNFPAEDGVMVPVPEEESKDDEQVAIRPLPDLQGASAISFKGKVSPTVAGVLRRVHQNLGHPPMREMIRHLRIGGASEAVIRAAEQMVCRTCENSSRAKPHKVETPAVALDFNEVIACDIIWIDTAESQNWPALNIVDVASTYQVVVPLKSTGAEEVGQALCSGWFRWAGCPKYVLVDLDSAFKGDFLDLMGQRSIIVRSAAGQAHWQNGIAERHGETWKLIWAKLVEDHLVLDYEMDEATSAVSDSKNQLRNRSGFSPRQWVFGSNPRALGDPFDEPNNLSTMDATSTDDRFARLQALRTGAKAAFFQVQTKSAFQRAVAHQTRTQPTEFQAGDLVYFYREVRQGKSKKPSAFWSGPATVIGREGQNYWLARGGRCFLCAPEHLRMARHEEVSEALRLKMAMKDVRRLLEDDKDEYMEIDESYVPEPEVGEMEMEVDHQQEGGRQNPKSTPALDMVASREAAIRSAVKRNQLLDDVPQQFKKARQDGDQQVFMMKRCISTKGKEKQLEKELPWGLIPPDERHLYKAAEEKQWLEHVDFGAVRALSVEESQEVLKTVPADRILNSRFAYRDKNYTKRKGDDKIPPKPKARLCVAGQWDPDLGVKDMATDAPTVCRQSVILALQLSLARSWKVSVGDIRAAFLNGIPAPRRLFFRQPKSGMPTLAPGQIIEVLKGVFGLSTSPKLWWTKLSTDLLKMTFTQDGATLSVKQNPIDPCIFMLIDDTQTSGVCGLLLTHVDDIMLLCDPAWEDNIHAVLKCQFPIEEWEKSDFEYVGCEFKCREDTIDITQLNYASNRVDKVTILPQQKDEDLATREQVEENRTSIGSLSWLAKQTRPDLQFDVSQSQKKQSNPTVADLKFTNKIVDVATKYKDYGLSLKKIPESEIAIIAFHDAAWGNTSLDDHDAQDQAWTGNHQVASQLGSLVVAADRKCLRNSPGSFSLLVRPWRAVMQLSVDFFSEDSLFP